ncbi:MAG: glycerol-3-phosphate 1-O-acyltransferase PlsY [Candidatus Kapaibacterium sp.]|nr:glycerol-3-phosphate 1-O-acyltransferase PlsY [Ignavibacteriota bacterium]MCB9220980.1 glycerol-3-phosphate 1-O-acyltransferase PlsY [Ignavibacteria bacterium]
MSTTLALIIIAALSYLVGSIPIAVIVSKKLYGFDIRDKGSGNMGSTNAFRVMGWKVGILVQLLDIAKGAFAVIVIAGVLGSELAIPNMTSFEDFTLIKLMAGIFAVLGHIFSAFVNFKGGKGINTATGMLIGIAPIDAGVAVVFFLIAVTLSGYISLGSLLAAFTLPSSLIFRYNVLHDSIPGYGTIVYFFLGLFLLIIYTHRSNIKRLLEGTENRFPKLQIFKRSG